MSIRSLAQRVRATRISSGKRAWIWKLIPFMAIAGLAFLVSPWLIGEPCPLSVSIATGTRDGAYFGYANKYRTSMQEAGVEINVIPTSGSIDNLNRLKSGEVMLGIVQGGTANPEHFDDLQSLACLYLEPLWVFHRADIPCDELTDLHGRKLAIGIDGSGTQALTKRLLEDNGLFDSTADAASAETRIQKTGGRQAANALLSGDSEVAFLVRSPESLLIRELIASPDIQLMSFRRAAGYERRYPYLEPVTLPAGAVDMQAHLPAKDIELLAPKATLVASKDFHPALIAPLLNVVTEVHHPGNLLQKEGQFPAAESVEIPLADSARRYFDKGPSFFYRYFSFRVAEWLDRMKLLLLPFVTLLFPLIKTAPPLYRWRIRHKIYKWYRVLRAIDLKLQNQPSTEEISTAIETLELLDEELAEITVPLSYMEEFYNLRLHIQHVIDRLKESHDSMAHGQTILPMAESNGEPTHHVA